MADSLDGVVYRARRREYDMIRSIEDGAVGNAPQVGVYQSFYGTSGWHVDIICDGLGGLLFVIAIYFRFVRHPPQKCKC